MKQNGLKRKSGHDLTKQRMNNRSIINLLEWRKTSLDIYRRQLTNRLFKRMKISSILHIAAMVIFISISPLSAESVRKIGNTCPQGYHTDGSSGYCVSSSNKNAPQVVFRKSEIHVHQGIIQMERAGIVPRPAVPKKKI